MNLKRLLNYVCLSGALALLFTACQEDQDIDNVASVAEQPDIAVENGMLHFKDQSVWAATIQEMKDAEDYGEYVAALGFENSLRAKYDAIEMEEGAEFLEELFDSGKLPDIQDNLFASLLNDKAMMKIGNTLHRVTDKYTFSVEDEDGSMREQFQESSSLDKRRDVTVFENVDHLAGKTLIAKDEEGNEVARFQGSDSRSWAKPGSTTTRSVIGAWSKTWGTYASVGVEMETQSYRAGGIFNSNRRWRSRASDYLFVYGETFTQQCRPLGCDNKSLKTGGTIKSGSRRVDRVLADVNIPIPGAYWYVTDYVEGDYKVRYDAGEPVREISFRFE